MPLFSDCHFRRRKLISNLLRLQKQVLRVPERRLRRAHVRVVVLDEEPDVVFRCLLVHLVLSLVFAVLILVDVFGAIC